MCKNPGREELVALIEQRKKEIAVAGELHKRDLIKNLHRLQNDLRQYDKFMREAGKIE